jgi:hypothetical protein
VGDFNALCTDFQVNNYRLWQLVNRPTHGRNILDKCFFSQPYIYQASEYLSLVKTKHKAVLVQPLSGIDSRDVRPRHKVRFYDMRAHNIDRLRYAFGTYNWSDITMMTNIDYIYSEFIDVFRTFLEKRVPPPNQLLWV